jgi:hypothetical protein
MRCAFPVVQFFQNDIAHRTFHTIADRFPQIAEIFGLAFKRKWFVYKSTVVGTFIANFIVQIRLWQKILPNHTMR